MVADPQISPLPISGGPAAQLHEAGAIEPAAQRAIRLGKRQREKRRAAHAQHLRRCVMREHFDLVACANEANGSRLGVALNNSDLLLLNFDPRWGMIPGPRSFRINAFEINDRSPNGAAAI